MNTIIYILKLQNNKYYVGKTTNFEKRKIQHINGTASYWTKKYKIISVEKIIPNSSIFDEDRYTKEYMNKYGIDNVRGGAYVRINLDNYQKQLLQKELWNANDLCIKCGSKTHFIKNCYEKDTIIKSNTSFCDTVTNFFKDLLYAPTINRHSTLF